MIPLAAMYAALGQINRNAASINAKNRKPREGNANTGHHGSFGAQDVPDRNGYSAVTYTVIDNHQAD